MTAFACLLLPWLNPFAVGPSAAVVPWLASAACGLLAWALAGAAPNNAATALAPCATRNAALWALIALAIWIVWRAPEVTNESATAFGALALLGLMMLLGAEAMARPDWWRAFAGVWLAAALISSVIGLLQYAGWSNALGPWINSASLGESFANLRQRNQLASLTNIGLLAVLWFVSRGLRTPAAVAAVALLATGNAATASRTGLVQMLLVVALTAMWTRTRHLRLLAFALGAYLVGAMALPWMLETFAGQVGTSALFRLSQELGCSSRTVLWSNVLHLISQKPLLGWGWGELDYAHYVTLYEGPRFCDILDNAHNLPLHLAVELGVPMALAFCAGLVWLFWRAQPWRETDPARQMAAGVLAVILLHSLLEYPLWYGPFQIACGLCLGMLLAPQVVGAHSQRGSRPALMPRLAIAGVLLALCGYAAWDYYRISQIYISPQSRAPGYRNDTLEKIRESWLFRRQVQFADLTTTPLTSENAVRLNRMANELLHFSPEPKVIEKLIESAVMLGRDDEARFHIARYRAAFAEAHAKWAAQLAKPL